MTGSATRGVVFVAAAVLWATGCSSSSDPTTSAESSTTPVTTTSSTTAAPSSSSSSPTQAGDEEKAGEAVVAFYKELDLVAQGKARLDSFRHAASVDGKTGTLSKWQGLLSKQLLAGNVQVGDTAIQVVSTVPGKKVKSGSDSWPSWTVVACVDHSGAHLEKDGKPVESSAPGRETVTHVVVNARGAFRVLGDDPGKSC